MELYRLIKQSSNEIEKNIRAFATITSLNIRSLMKHFPDLRNDFKMKTTQIMCVQETWCQPCMETNDLNIDGFELHLLCQGNGKGIATYFKKDFKITGESNNKKFQMAIISNGIYHIINIPYSAS